MKTIALLLALSLTGCVLKYDRVIAVKSTVFGFDASQAADGKPRIRFGLIRDYILVLPTATNEVHVAPFSSHVDADLGALKQSAVEDFSTKD